MSESIAHNIVSISTNSSSDAVMAAAKTIRDKVGNLLEMRGFSLKSKKPYAEGKCYGADFRFEPVNPLTDGCGINLRYFPDENPDRLSLRFVSPAYQNYNGQNKIINMNHQRSDYVDALSSQFSHTSDESKLILESLLDNFDTAIDKQIRNNKSWRNCISGNGAFDNIELIVKFLEKAWPMYLLKYQFSKIEAVEYQQEHQDFSSYKKKVKECLGGDEPSSEHEFGSSIVIENNIGQLKEVNIEIDIKKRGTTTLNSITLDKESALDFLKHLMKWRRN
jgi:hypothetical protein